MNYFSFIELIYLFLHYFIIIPNHFFILKPFVFLHLLEHIMNKYLIPIIFILIGFQYAEAQKWQPDAGLISPYSAEITSSSGKNVNNITDGNSNTYWESGNLLPFHYLSDINFNFFLNKKNLSTAVYKKYTQAFDGNSNTYALIDNGKINILLKRPFKLKILTLKAHFKDSLKIVVLLQNKPPVVYKLFPKNNYQLYNFKLPKNIMVTGIKLISPSPFDLFELGALYRQPFEWVKFDFKKKVNIGWINSRYLNNKSIKSIIVYYSNDNKNWKKLISLNPIAIPLLKIPLQHIYKARYLKIIFNLDYKNYLKARLWEFDVYNRYGPFGKPPFAVPSKYSFSKSFGLNTFWGWGYNEYSDKIPPGKGPYFFLPVTHLIRSYHMLDWDMKTPSLPPNFKLMAKGKGTPSKKWLNWDREYNFLKNIGFKIDVSLTFKQENFPDTLWKHPVAEAFLYGKRFANHFYNSQHNIIQLEIGNEPWNYKSTIYKNILYGMSEGINSVSSLPVYGCAVQAYELISSDNNYIAKYLTQKAAINLSGLNTHIYPYVFNEAGIRIAVNPEDRRAATWSLANLRRFRDINMPGKSIIVTEFGYDSKGGNEDCIHSECVSELKQAVFGVRMALILWRLGAEQFYWYFYANNYSNSYLHERSGLTGSYKTGFVPKLSYFAFKKLQKLLGPYNFSGVIREDNKVYAYSYVNPVDKKEIIIAWRPLANNQNKIKDVSFYCKSSVKKIIPLIGTYTLPFKLKDGIIDIKLSGIPVIIFL